MYIHIYNRTHIHTLIPPAHCLLSFQSPQVIVKLFPRSCPTILNGYYFTIFHYFLQAQSDAKSSTATCCQACSYCFGQEWLSNS